MDLYCENPECDELQDGHGIYCASCRKRKQRGKDLSAPRAEKLTPMEKALELAGELADCDPTDDKEYERRRRALKLALRVLSRKERSEVAKEGAARARARGVRLGRPPRLTPELAREYVQKHGSIGKAAAAAKVTWRTMSRALSEAGAMQKSSISAERVDRPRSGG